MSSTRLPGKTLMDLHGMPVVDRVIARAKSCSLADDVIVATTTDATDDVLARHLDRVGAAYVRGSLDDVLDRYLLAARERRADTIVRITCDCPLVDPMVIDEVISAFRQGGVDYCANTLVRSYPIGMDTEVFSAAALERAASEASLLHEREHVTPYIYQHPDIFALRNVEAPEWARWPELRLTLDERSDFEVLKALLDLVSERAGLREMLDTLRAHPEIASANAGVEHRHIAKPSSW